ncbi:hypothetical protein [Streptomyces sp. NPDC127066]
MSPEDGADIAHSSLTLGERVGSGGQGDVHSVGGGDLLYKAPSK